MEFTPGDKNSLDIRIHFKKGNSPEVKLDIYSCSLEKPPERCDDPDARKSCSFSTCRSDKLILSLAVEKVAVLHVQFSNADLSKLPTNRIREEGQLFKDVWYDIGMKCEAVVADASGVLEFVVTYEGQPCGTTKVDFQA